MHVRYRKRRGRPIPNYVCVGRGKLFGDPLCQSLVGTSIDAAVGTLVAEAVTPMAIEMSLAVQEEVERRADDADRLRDRQVERAQCEADLARQRFMRVDPQNRLVADSLEADWNAKLRVLDQARDDYERQRRDSRISVNDEQRARILALATDFPAGTTMTLTLPRPLTAIQLRTTHPEVRHHIHALLDEHTDAQVAHLLNQRGLRTGSEVPFDAVSIQWVRVSTKLPRRKDRLLADGMLTATQLCEKLGASRTTIKLWSERGLLEARLRNGKGQWLYRTPDQIPPHAPPKKRLAKNTAGRSNVRGAV